MKKQVLQGFCALAVFLFALYFWTIPFTDNRLPYGDVDSSTHFALADYMAQTNTVTYYLPYYFNFSYGDEGGGKLWYPPQYHTSAAALQKVSGADRVFSMFFFQALTATVLLLSTYLLVKSLYGFLPAITSMVLLMFSARDLFWYLSGQYPQVMSFGLIPLTVYFAYQLFLEKEKARGWTLVSLLGVSAGMQFFIHPQSILLSVIAIGVLTISLWIKNKRFPFLWRHIIVLVIVAFALIAPFYQFPFGGQTIYLGESGNLPFSLHLEFFSSLFRWYGLNEVIGVSQEYYSFKAMHGGLWILPLFLLGVVFMLLKRRPQDIVYLALLVAFFIGVHDPLLGTGRYERYLETEAMIIYPIAVIGLISLMSFTPKNIRSQTQIVACIVLIAIAVFTLGASAQDVLKQQFEGPRRINQERMDASNWMKGNLPQDADVLMVGTLWYPNKKWMQALSHRHGIWDDKNQFYNMTDHVLIDISDASALPKDQAQTFFAPFVRLDNELSQSAQRVYDKGAIRIYRLNSSESVI